MKTILPFMSRARLTIIGLVLGLNAGMAQAAVVAVVSVKNPVIALTRNQVVDIFLGRANRFPDGNQAVPIDQAESSAVRDEFYLKFAGKSPAQIKAYWSKIIFTGRGQPPREASDSADVKKFIARNPNAIGYIEPDKVDDTVKILLAQ